jgi:hypothetical protein
MPRSSLTPSEQWGFSFGSAWPPWFFAALRRLFVDTSRSDGLKSKLIEGMPTSFSLQLLQSTGLFLVGSLSGTRELQDEECSERCEKCGKQKEDVRSRDLNELS